MNIPVFQIDAFTQQAFAGNPAAICPLNEWLPDELMRAVAAENNLAETAFFVPVSEGRYQLRWFTPTVEVELCGHATLATAWVLWHKLGELSETLRFETLSGELVAKRLGARIQLNFPARPSEPCEVDPVMQQALGGDILECRAGANRIAILKDEETVRTLTPDMPLLGKLDYGIIVTAEADDSATDFVSRYFGVPFGIDEDPVTGSAHCDLMPYWVERIGKQQLQARQVSARGGEISCELLNSRVLLTGDAVCVLSGELHLPG